MQQRAFIAVIVVVMVMVGGVWGVDNSLADCEYVASYFDNTCDTTETPPATVALLTGKFVVCLLACLFGC